MARLYITSFNKVADAGKVQAAVMGDDETYESEDITTSSVASSILDKQFVSLTAGADCHVAFGADPTAVRTAGSEVGERMVAGQTKVFAVQAPGQTKLAVIASA